MTKMVSLFGLLIAICLGAIALGGMPSGGGVLAVDESQIHDKITAVACSQSNLAADEGYGVNRQTLGCAQR